MVREKYLENDFFSRSGKSQEILWMVRRKFRGWSERTWKVREKSGNLKINGCGRQTVENLFFSRREKMYFLMRKSKPISLLNGCYP